MSFEAITGIAILTVALVVVGLLVFRKRPRRVKSSHYTARWKEIQKLCPDKNNWAQVVVEADELLDDVLKKRRYKGKSMGERLVSAQKVLSDNDGVWFAHKLRKKVEAEPETKLKKADVQDALFAIRQTLKDLGAL